jgi:hypothetical protein
MKNQHGIAAAVPAVAGHVVWTSSLSPPAHKQRRMNVVYSGGVDGTDNNYDKENARRRSIEKAQLPN